AGSEILGFRALRAKRPAPTADAPSSRLLEQWKPSRLPAFLFSRCSRISQRATSFPPAQTSQRAGSCEMRPMVSRLPCESCRFIASSDQDGGNPETHHAVTPTAGELLQKGR